MFRSFLLSAAIAGSAAASTLLGATAVPVDGASCESLAALKLPDTTIARAEVVAAGAFVPPANPQAAAGRGGGGRGGNAFATLPSFCRVVASVEPTSDSAHSRSRVWLPAADWNGRFQAAGGAAGENSAVAGGINFPALANQSEAAMPRPEQIMATRVRRSRRSRPSGKAGRLRLSRDARNDRQGEGARRGLLRQGRPIPIGTRAPPVVARNFRKPSATRPTITASSSLRPPTPGAGCKAVDVGGTRAGQLDHRPGSSRRRSMRRCIRPSSNSATPSTASRTGIIENQRAAIHASTSSRARRGDEPVPKTPGADRNRERHLCAGRRHAERPNRVSGVASRQASLAGRRSEERRPRSYASETFKYLVFNDPGWTPAAHPINLGADVTAAERNAAPITADNPDLSAFFARGGKLIQVHGWTRPAHRARRQRRLLQQGSRESRRQSGGREHQAVHGAWHESLPGR